MTLPDLISVVLLGGDYSDETLDMLAAYADDESIRKIDRKELVNIDGILAALEEVVDDTLLAESLAMHRREIRSFLGSKGYSNPENRARGLFHNSK